MKSTQQWVDFPFSIFVYDVENVIKVRTGEEGYEALQD